MCIKYLWYITSLFCNIILFLSARGVYKQFKMLQCVDILRTQSFISPPSLYQIATVYHLLLTAWMNGIGSIKLMTGLNNPPNKQKNTIEASGYVMLDHDQNIATYLFFACTFKGTRGEASCKKSNTLLLFPRTPPQPRNPDDISALEHGFRVNGFFRNSRGGQQTHTRTHVCAQPSLSTRRRQFIFLGTLFSSA